MTNNISYIIVLIFFITWDFIFAQNPGINSPLSTMQGFFSKTLENSANNDSVAGNFYYYDNGKLFFKIEFPLNQIMFIEKNITTIYYPDSNEGFELESVNPVILPLVTGMLAAIREDYGLSIMGFEMFDQNIDGDTLITYWSHPLAQEKAGIHIVKNYMDKLYSAEYQAADSISKVITFFKEYIDIEDLLLPTVIESQSESLSGFVEEKVILSKLKLNSKIQNEIKLFTIPESAKMTKRKW